MSPVPPQQENPFSILTPQERAMAQSLVQSGDMASVYKLLENRRELNREQSKKLGGFDNRKDFITAMQQTRKLATEQLKKSRTSLDKFGQATDIVKQRGGFDKMNGADDTILMKAFASMILPGEAVMSDDIRIIAQQEGLPGWFKSYAAQLEGGQLKGDQRRTIYKSMNNLAERAYKENIGIRQKFGSDIEYGGFKENDIFDPQLGYNPYSMNSVAPQVVPAAQLNPSDFREPSK
jgi:hypothetical protein